MPASRVWPKLAWSFVLLAVFGSAMACNSRGVGPRISELDRRLLSQVEQLLAPVPHFSGSSIEPRDFNALGEGACPAGLNPAALRATRHAQRIQLAHLGRELSELVQSRPGDAAVLRLQALWTLLEEPTSQGRERVVRLLQAALKREPASIGRKNDLAAAYLLRASVDGETSDLPAALELLDTVAAKHHPPVVALFNQAYALQCLALWGDAKAAWRRLPGAPSGLSSVAPPAPLSPSSSGISLASERSGAEPAPGIDPLALRRRGEWLLGEWGARASRGDRKGSQDLLAEAEGIGARLQARSGDQLLSRSVHAIRQAQATGDPGKLLQLQRGHAAFHSIRRDLIYSDCRPKILQLAQAQLGAAGTPFVGWVQLDQAVCAYFDKDFPRAERILVPLRLTARRQKNLALEGRADWILGLIRMVQARFVEADRLFSDAKQLFNLLGEEAYVIYLHSLRAKCYEYGGAPKQAWGERLAALSGRQAVDPERLFTILNDATQATRRQGHPLAALRFLREQTRAAERGARETGKTDLLAFTLLYRADLLSEIGRRAEALGSVAQAELAWSQLDAGNESRRRLRLELDVRHALLDRNASCQEAIAAVDRTIAFLAGPSSSLGTQVEILKLYQLRSQLDLRQGAFAAARADLLRGIAEVERQRLEVATNEDRARFVAQRRDLFLELIRLELDQFHDPFAALAVLERSSNRALADATQSHEGGWTVEASHLRDRLTAALPRDTLVIRFGHLPDRLLLWTFLDGQMQLEQRPLPEGELAREIQACRDLLASGAPVAERESACSGVARAVMPRRLRELPAGSRVFLIPDETLATLPFAALRMSAGTPYLAEKFRLSYLPSLTLSLAQPRSQGRAIGPPRTALFVSDPAFNRELFPSLPRLTGARQSVSVYASHYLEPEVLSDREATVPAVVAALDQFDLVQFDSHGITNSQFPERGGLLLAPAAQAPVELRSALLTAEDLPASSLRRLRLVVLGACSTGLTTYQDTAEVTGLAAAFLARGVPEVIGAAWPVPDGPSALLLDRFHRELAAGKATDEALQSAQLALLHSKIPEAARIKTWAGFQLFRGMGEIP